MEVKCALQRLAETIVGFMHYLRDLQIFFFRKITSKMGPMALFTYLKVILLQCFQFSAISDIQTDPKSKSHIYIYIYIYILNIN